MLIPLLIIFALQALLREFRAGVPWEDLYAYSFVIIADYTEECVRILLAWKKGMGRKGLRVNAGKTNIMIGGTGLDLLQNSGKFPCALYPASEEMLRMQALSAQEVQWAQACG